MFIITVAAFATAIEKTRLFKVCDELSDFSRHRFIVS